jgi:hypothetical protein
VCFILVFFASEATDAFTIKRHISPLYSVDEVQVVYPAGHNVVVYNTEKKTQRFVPLAAPGETQGSGVVTAMAVSSLKYSNNKSKLLAVAERGAVRPSVTICELNTLKRKGKQALSSPDVASREFVSVAFSPDGKYLLTQGGAPDWTLVNWRWDLGRQLQVAKVTNQLGAAIHQVRSTTSHFSFCQSLRAFVFAT